MATRFAMFVVGCVAISLFAVPLAHLIVDIAEALAVLGVACIGLYWIVSALIRYGRF